MTSRRPIPRGIRNNNPLNIRIGNVWLGEEPNPTDPDFEQFTSMVYGVRAGFILLRRYIRHYNTTKYIDTVCEVSGIPQDATLDYYDKEQMFRLVDAMIYVECGQHISEQHIRDGYRFA